MEKEIFRNVLKPTWFSWIQMKLKQPMVQVKEKSFL